MAERIRMDNEGNRLEGLTFSNPRTEALFDDWPIGRQDRGKCHFVVETGKRGERVSRCTTDKNGQWCKPKKTTYNPAWCIVDGSDGRTYLLSGSNLACEYGRIYVYMSDLQHMLTFCHVLRPEAQYRPADSERFDELAALLTGKAVE